MAVTSMIDFAAVAEPFQMNGFEAGSQFGAALAAQADGGFAVAYGNAFSTSNTLALSLFTSTGAAALEGENYVLPYSGAAGAVQMTGEPLIAEMASGDLVLRWRATVGNQVTIMTSVVDDEDGHLLQSRQMISPIQEIQSLDMAVAHGRQIVAAIDQFSFSGPNFYVRDAVGDHIVIQGSNTIVFADFANVSITATGGGFIHTMIQLTANGNPVWVQFHGTDGMIDGAPFVIDAVGTFDANATPVVTGLPGGGFAVAYTAPLATAEGAVPCVLLRIFDDLQGNPDGRPPVRVDTGGMLAGVDPDVAVLASGMIVVTWSAQVAGGTSSVYARIIAPNGSIISAPFRLSDGVSGASDPSIAALASGDLVAAWTDTATDDFGASIHGGVWSVVRTTNGDDANNLITGDALRDSAEGGAGHDVLRGMGADDSLFGGTGNDSLDGGTGNDLLDGGTGNDTFTVDSVSDLVFEAEGAGVDTIVTSVSLALGSAVFVENLEIQDAAGTDPFDLFGNQIANTLRGNAGNNILHGGGANDTLFGGVGDDTLVGGAGDDTLDGGQGSDTADYSGTTRVLVDLSQTDPQNVDGSGLDRLIGIENVTGSSADDRLTGNAEANVLVGQAGNDLLDGGTGNDTLDGGLGNDTYFVDSAGDVVRGEVASGSGGGIDTVITSVDFTAPANVEIISAIPGTAPLNLTGNDAADTLTGNDGANRLDGRGGNDNLAGNGGTDTLNGGDGTDTLNGGAGDDFIFGGATAADLRDVAFGGDGRDSIDGGAGNDELNGGNGNDTVLGGAGADTLVGNEDNDLIAGGTGGDLMSGNAGNDTLNGGFGFDRMNGGTGADQFFHQGVRDHGSDWIQDYNAAEGDVLAVGIAGATAGQFQVNFATTVGAGSASVQEAFVIYRPTGQILWALIDGGADAQINLAIGGQVFDLLL